LQNGSGDLKMSDPIELPPDNRSSVAPLPHSTDVIRKEHDPLTEMVEDASRLKAAVERLVLHIRDRLGDKETPERKKKALRKEISLTLASLEKVEAALSTQLRNLNRGLAKADARIASVADSDYEELMEGLKKARKKIDKTVE
jgi:hypothetical protein